MYEWVEYASTCDSGRQHKSAGQCKNPQACELESKMAHDKRKKPRKRPDQLVYVDLGSDNGGILLNASEEGFSFQAVGPVLETGTIHFRFTISKGRRVEGDGELTWTDATKKVGGLRFTNISPELREQVRGWLSQS